MARQPRLTAAGYPHHVIQRGNNRQPIVLDDDDRAHLLEGIRTQAATAQVAVHAYVLMTNHVHLLVTPHVPGASSRMMQAIGRRYVGCFNARYQRTGTLWEGRFKSALVDPLDLAVTLRVPVPGTPTQTTPASHEEIR